MEGSETVVPSGTEKRSSDIVAVIFSILFFVFVIVTFLAETKIQWFRPVVALVIVPVEACCWWSQLHDSLAAADECKHDVTEHVRKTRSETENEMESIFQKFSP